MDLQGIFDQVISLLGTASPQVALVVFLICAVGEFGFSIPFILETFLILCGYQLSKGQLSPFSLALLITGTVGGRVAGSVILYYLSRYGSLPLIRFYKRRFEKKISDKNAVPQKITAGLSHLSPFAVAFGRLLWLRIPLTLTLGAQRRAKTLIIAVFLAAVVWDASYIILGATAGTAVMAHPLNMVLYSVAGLSFLYGMAFAVRRIRRYLAARKQEKLT
jgi:membrane protein DedA with SNARE-associated domain